MPTSPALYEQDFYSWALTTAAAIRNGEWQDLDWPHIAEELEDLGISREHALTSHLEQLLMHLLKWRYQPSRRQLGHSWEYTIANARRQLWKLLRRNPRLQTVLREEWADSYHAARRLARIQTRLPLATFPEACPWTIEQVLDDDFWPEP